MISKVHLLWRPDRALVTASGSAEHKSELEARRNEVKRQGTSFFIWEPRFVVMNGVLSAYEWLIN